MKKHLKKISCLVLAITMLLSATFNIYASELDVEKLDSDIDFLKLVIEFVNEYYQYDINQDDIITALYDGFFEILDDYSIYFTKEEYQEFATDMSGSFGGIGVQITQDKDKLIVAIPLPGTPALKAGIKTGDEIISVNGQSVVGFTTTQASNLIRGEVGTVVKIGIKRGNTEIFFNIKREVVVVSSVESKILENKIGYLKITEFNENTTEQVEEALTNFDKNKVSKIIVDVRNNPGGSLRTVVDILNFFVPEGPLVYVNSKTQGEEVLKSTLDKQKYKVCVLVNENSASASELFAGAIQDRGVGKIIGTTTYGKGVVQSLIPIDLLKAYFDPNYNNGGAVKFTTSEYFTPNKNKVQGVGIKPDIVIENKIGQSKVDLSTYPELKKDRKPTLNTIGLDVLGAEMILQTLGYKVNTPDGILDQVTFEQIKLFQKNNNLNAYGTLDFATQDALTSALKLFAAPEVEDTQLKKAIEILK